MRLTKLKLKRQTDSIPAHPTNIVNQNNLRGSMLMTSPKFKDQLSFKKNQVIQTQSMVEVKGANKQKVSIPKFNMNKVLNPNQPVINQIENWDEKRPQ